MPDSETEYWNSAYRRYPSPPRCDSWLEPHRDLLNRSREVPVIDLGCGSGRDCSFLQQEGFRVIAGDFSRVALCTARQHFDGVSVLELDLRHPLPLAEDRALVMISDLSLHYFNWATTVRIVDEMSRVLRRGGVLFCRVNSTHAVNYAGQGVEVERHYYDINGHMKRFFTEQEVIDLLRGWEMLSLKAYPLWEGRKHVIEAVCVNTP